MKIAVYSDSIDFGGHEIMIVKIANALSKRHDVYFLFFNKELGDKLSESVHKIRIPVSSKRPYGGLNSLNIRDILYLRRIFSEIKPELSIISQGLIELGLKGMWASRLARIKTVSYIPLCLSYREMKAPLGWIRDLFNQKYYNLFDGFITISEEQKHLIERYLKVKKNVFVLNNFVALSSMQINATKDAPHEGTLRIGLIGRIVFAQKGQDRTIDIARILKNRSINFKFIIVGEGKDKGKLLKLVKKNELDDFFLFKGWVADKKAVYSDMDVVLSTSNFEGVPLVLLECIAFKKMIIAPNKGIFKEYLDAEFLYSSYEEAAYKLSNVEPLKKRFEGKITEMREGILKKYNRLNFENTLYSIIDNFK